MTRLCPQCQSDFSSAMTYCPLDNSVLAENRSGEVIAGKYLLESLLGVGSGGGAVWRASQKGMGRTVALKLVVPDDRMTLERFARGARWASGLSHSHITTVHDYGDAADGMLYMVMECLEGRSLKQVLEEDGPLAPERAVHIGVQVLRGLEAAHAAGIVHRDLKPENVMLVREDEDRDFVKILDFGIAKAQVEAEMEGETPLSITQGWQLCGTPLYMAPELFSGEPADGRADLYAMGIVLFELLTGQVPFDGRALFEVLNRHLSETAPAMATLRPELARWPDLDDIVARALAKGPEHRFPTAKAMREALASVTEREVVATFAFPPGVPVTRRGGWAAQPLPFDDNLDIDFDLPPISDTDTDPEVDIAAPAIASSMERSPLTRVVSTRTPTVLRTSAITTADGEEKLRQRGGAYLSTPPPAPVDNDTRTTPLRPVLMTQADGTLRRRPSTEPLGAFTGPPREKVHEAVLELQTVMHAPVLVPPFDRSAAETAVDLSPPPLPRAARRKSRRWVLPIAAGLLTGIVSAGAVHMMMEGRRGSELNTTPMMVQTDANAGAPSELTGVAQAAAALAPLAAEVSGGPWDPAVSILAMSDIRVTSEPTGAEVFHDGRRIGRTPLTATVPEGEARFVLALKGYRPVTSEVLAIAGGSSERVVMVADASAAPKRVGSPQVAATIRPEVPVAAAQIEAGASVAAAAIATRKASDATARRSAAKAERAAKAAKALRTARAAKASKRQVASAAKARAAATAQNSVKGAAKATVASAPKKTVKAPTKKAPIKKAVKAVYVPLLDDMD